MDPCPGVPLARPLDRQDRGGCWCGAPRRRDCGRGARSAAPFDNIPTCSPRRRRVIALRRSGPRAVLNRRRSSIRRSVGNISTLRRRSPRPLEPRQHDITGAKARPSHVRRCRPVPRPVLPYRPLGCRDRWREPPQHRRVGPSTFPHGNERATECSARRRSRPG